VASGVAVTRADIPFFLEMLVTLMCGIGDFARPLAARLVDGNRFQIASVNHLDDGNGQDRVVFVNFT